MIEELMLITIVILFVAILLVYAFYSRLISKIKEEHRTEIVKAKKEAIDRSRSSIEGRVYENLVPFLPYWKYTPSDARFLANPVDYIVFEGMSSGEPTEIVIVEIKKGKSFNTKMQNKLKKLVEEGKVRWETLKID